MIEVIVTLFVAALAVAIAAAVSQKFVNLIETIHEKFACMVNCVKNSQE